MRIDNQLDMKNKTELKPVKVKLYQYPLPYGRVLMSTVKPKNKADLNKFLVSQTDKNEKDN